MAEEVITLEKVMSKKSRDMRKSETHSIHLTEDNYRIIFDNSAVAITVTDENEDLVLWNKFAQTLLGMEHDDLYLKPVKELYPDDEWHRIRSENIRQKGMHHHMETRIITKSKETIEVDLSISVLKGSNSSVRGSIGIIRDISERKKADHALHESMELSRGMIETATTAIFVIKDDQFTFANHVMEEISGYSAQDLIGMNRLDLIYDEYREQAKNNILEISKSRSSNPLEFRILRKDLETAWVSEKLTAIAHNDKQHILGNWMDITEWKLAEAVSRDHARQTEVLLEVGSTVSRSLNLKDTVESVLNTLAKLLPERPVAFFLLPAQTNRLDLLAHRGFSKNFITRMTGIKLGRSFIGRVALMGKPITLSSTLCDPRFDSTFLKQDDLCSVCSVPIFARDQVKGVICVGNREQLQSLDKETKLLELIANQIGIAVENALMYEKTAEMANTDSLTGLYNRRYLSEELERELYRADRKPAHFSVLSIDLDGFKAINDRFGHYYGDRFLGQLSTILKAEIRKSDIAARVGGDEFIALLFESDLERAKVVAQRIWSRVNSQPIEINGEKCFMSVSIGIASYPEAGAVAEEILKKADTAMYESKKAGKNQIKTASL